MLAGNAKEKQAKPPEIFEYVYVFHRIVKNIYRILKGLKIILFTKIRCRNTIILVLSVFLMEIRRFDKFVTSPAERTESGEGKKNAAATNGKPEDGKFGWNPRLPALYTVFGIVLFDLFQQ